MSELLGEAERRLAVLTDLGRALAAGPITREAAEAAAPWISSAGPGDLVAAVDALVAEGLPFERLKPAVSRLINLLSKPLATVAFAPEDPFFRSLVLENEALLSLLGSLKAPIARLAAARSTSPSAALNTSAAGRGLADAVEAIVRGADALSGIEAHYRKKENVLFPHVEARHPRYRCISLMWALHDDVRRGVRDAAEAARDTEAAIQRTEAVAGLAEEGAASPRPAIDRLNAVLGRLFFDAGAVAFREEKALFPAVAPLFRPDELSALYREARDYGFFLLRPEQIEALDGEARKALAPSRETAAPEGRVAPEGIMQPETPLALDAGNLSREIVDLILKSLPVDLTFVDAEDRVRYFSNGQERVFPRSPSIIGRAVGNCHPASSVGRVMAIIGSFREGRRDREEFWLETGGRFVRIEYIALRDADGAYLGTLEASQDLTRARSLSGEKRLAE